MDTAHHADRLATSAAGEGRSINPVGTAAVGRGRTPAVTSNPAHVVNLLKANQECIRLEMMLAHHEVGDDNVPINVLEVRPETIDALDLPYPPALVEVAIPTPVLAHRQQMEGQDRG